MQVASATNPVVFGNGEQEWRSELVINFTEAVANSTRDSTRDKDARKHQQQVKKLWKALTNGKNVYLHVRLGAGGAGTLATEPQAPAAVHVVSPATTVQPPQLQRVCTVCLWIVLAGGCASQVHSRSFSC